MLLTVASRDCENDRERQGNNNSSLLSQKGVDGNTTLVSIVISNQETISDFPRDESSPMLSPKKGHLSRTSSSHEQCRVCQQDIEKALIDLGCHCRGGLTKAHRSCIDTWFTTRGSNQCKICQNSCKCNPSRTPANCRQTTWFRELPHPSDHRIVKGDRDASVHFGWLSLS